MSSGLFRLWVIRVRLRKAVAIAARADELGAGGACTSIAWDWQTTLAPPQPDTRKVFLLRSDRKALPRRCNVRAPWQAKCYASRPDSLGLEAAMRLWAWIVGIFFRRAPATEIDAREALRQTNWDETNREIARRN